MQRPERPEEPSAGQYVVVCVADTGSGMTDEVRAKAFEPFFTTKGVGKGSGLGLSQVLGFAKQSGGGVCLDTRPGSGTAIHIYLPPAAQAETVPAAQFDDRVAEVQDDAVILLVDDDPAVREVTAATLENLGHAVIEAGSGGAALDLLDRHHDVSLVILDFAMPGMNGAELARHVGSRRPGLPVLFITGYADRAALAGVSEEQIVGKPFDDQELSRKVSRALRRERQLAMGTA